LDYERAKEDGKEGEQYQALRTVELVLSALAKCHPTDKDKLKFFELGLKRFVSKINSSNSSINAVALKVLDNFSGEHEIAMMTIFCV
jgi:hypothetical protein